MQTPASAPKLVQMGQRHNGEERGTKKYSGTKASRTGQIKAADPKATIDGYTESAIPGTSPGCVVTSTAAQANANKMPASQPPRIATSTPRNCLRMRASSIYREFDLEM